MELETKDLAERIEESVAKYNQMKFNHNVTPLENSEYTESAGGLLFAWRNCGLWRRVPAILT